MESPNSQYGVTIAIDFGTAGTGYGYAWNADPEKILSNRPWPCTPERYVKTSTELLVKREGHTFVAFGNQAREMLSNMDEEEAQQHLHFSRFKMQLHVSEGRVRQVDVKANNAEDKLPLKFLISLTLKHMKDRALEEVNNASTAPLSADDVRWVLTVPAIWDNAAKQFMVEAAREARLTDEGREGNILIAPEPEAASIYCVNSSTAIGPSDFPTGTKYMVADCGGGTVDVTVHETLPEGQGLREIYPPSGGDWGASYVNENFEDLLGSVFGKEIIKELKKGPQWIDIANEIEVRPCNRITTCP